MKATAIEIIEPYFSASWNKRSALEAFEIARANAANIFPQRGAEILAISFGEFRKSACDKSVKPTSIRSAH